MARIRRLLPAMLGAAALASACAPADASRPENAVGALIANRNLDLLFMIDSSSAMRSSQTNLTANLPMFMAGLENLSGGLPNIHVAVVSSDMGAGDGTVPGCSQAGDAGKFHAAPTGTCTETTLLSGATFIADVGGATNYSAPDISTVFACIAAIGDSGCGFARPFASVLRALGADGAPAPAENQGFLRADALLAIVMVTNQDDCSARPGENLYDVSAANMVLSSPLGPASSYRCNELGHLCGGVRPPRQAPGGDMNATVTLNNCGSAECDGSLIPVAEFAARIRALKAAPQSEVLVAAIAGPAAPYTVHWKAPSVADSGPWPEITHSCTAPDNSYADPGVRINDWINAFGANGSVYSICDTNFAPALQQIATRIGALLDAGGATGGPAGSIPSCAVTGLGGLGGEIGGTGPGGSSGAGGLGGDVGGGTVMPPGGGCGCQAGGASPGAFGLAGAGAVMAWLARRRRASGTRAPR